jgi:plastocyanin
MAASTTKTTIANKIMKPGLLFVAMFVLIAGLFAWTLASQDEASQQTAQSITEKFVVEITNDGYVPQTLQVPVGATVEWVNRTNDPHRIAANPQPDHSSFPDLDSIEPIGPNATYSFTFSTGGTYVYNNHYVQSENNGEVKVSDAQTE